MLSEVEEGTLQALIIEGSINKAAEKLRVKRNTISQRLLRMNLKEYKYQKWLDDFRKLKMRMPLKYVRI